MSAATTPGPQWTATLSDVYDLDMGCRTVDLDMWRAVCFGDQPEPVVVEVGCGRWRIPKQLHAAGLSPHRWVSIDVDAEMLAPTPPAPWAVPVLGDAAYPSTWVRVSASCRDGLADVVVIPYSTLTLIPHVMQGEVLRLARAAARAGSVIAFEVFELRADWRSSGVRMQAGGVRSPDGTPGGWVRRSRYDVDAAKQTTWITREYGPTGGSVQAVVEEVVYWRTPRGWVDLARAVGLDARALGPGGALSVPDGHLLVVGAA